MSSTIQKVFFPPTASAAIQLLSYWGIFAGGMGPETRWAPTAVLARPRLLSAGILVIHSIPQQTPSQLLRPSPCCAVAVGFVTRPVGALAFGHLGDTRGRGMCLLLSVIFMGVPTVIIGCLPTYAQAGAVAPALLALMRLVQGLAMGGEFGG